MATASQIANLKLRQPNLPAAATDSVIELAIDDAALELPTMGIALTDNRYDKCLSLYALHLLTMANVIKDPVAESVKGVSANYNKKQTKGGSVYEDELIKIIRRTHFPPMVLRNS